MDDGINLEGDARITRTEGLVESEVDGEVVILNIESGHFFQLNGMGSQIWRLLEAPMTFASLCAAIRERFEVAEEECRRDVAEFVQRMRGQGLVESV